MSRPEPSRYPAPARTIRRGFTLLEMMLVVLIMGILGTVAVFGAKGLLNQSRKRSTVASLKTIKGALELYNGRFGEYPPSLLNLTTCTDPPIEKIPRDAWQRDFQYFFPSSGNNPNSPFDLFSSGPSPQAGDDDITVENMDTIQ
ncbi:MAG: type II secretion system protein GspG [Phycisphaerales bacterium]